MDKVKLEILGLSSSQSQSGSFALVLGEEGGKRRLPIIIGMFEAQAIAIEIEKIIPNRPMTHDLFKSFAHSFNFIVKEVYIHNLKEGVFFAKIICNDGEKNMEIDARPSDAIAIGIRFNAPIFTNESIMNEASIELSEQSDEDEEIQGEAEENLAEQTAPEKKSAVVKGKEGEFQSISLDRLNKMLADSIEKEDYEKAAKIRDEINKRN
ncbi:bifunctional nuclease family protein [Aureibacter tunicatorum]|uniref:BFN domain-containing protein n=1 Tax=Aureibacter tunicatorum TaxID=866807 RepID=A0AAE3XNP4_9BACT|nr:bifunctional nuclease domain-containing protein [Aureibacter tunicatorum]MDR6239101.1 hypothetical protein [Aureibacter tunicatorum]BDD04973.1 hypothetical protein AUTU_24560 [Aureibacter tunicatorum]